VTDARTQKQRMLAGDLYSPIDPEIMADHEAAVAWMGRYNALDLPPSERHALLRERCWRRSATASASGRRSTATTATTSRSARGRSSTSAA
jgi:hypothetical protein